MPTRWTNKGFNRAIIFEALKSIRFSPTGSVSNGDIVRLEELTSALPSLLDFDDELTELERSHIVAAALTKGARQGKLNPESVLAAINSEAAALASKPCHPFVLITNWSIPKSVSLRRTINGRRITISSIHAEPFMKSRREKLKRFEGELPEVDVSSMAAVRIHTHSRSMESAFQSAFEAQDVLRAIWNLSLNLGRRRIFISPQHQPTNRVLVGPVHTIHRPDGDIDADQLWFEPDYSRSRLTIQSRQVQECARADNAFRQGLKRSRYAEWIQKGLVRYGTALDVRDQDVSFVRLWGALEFLTLTRNARYDDTIRRAVFPWKDPDYRREILLHLKENRNRSVHVGESSGQRWQHIDQLRDFVEQLILFHLRWSSKIASPDEAAKLLDLPTNRSDRSALAIHLEIANRILDS